MRRSTCISLARAAQAAWGRLLVMSVTRQARASVCLHDGSGKGCYGCAIMIGFGGALPQSAFDGLPVACKPHGGKLGTSGSNRAAAS